MNLRPDPPDTALRLRTPAPRSPEPFDDPAAAVARLRDLYAEATGHLAEGFAETMAAGRPVARFRAFYPEVRLTTTSFAAADSRLSFGHVAAPGTYATTITWPDLFANYLEQQIGLLLRNHGVPVMVGPSDTPMPIHFALSGQPGFTVPQDGAGVLLRDVFDVPDLATTNDDIVNGQRLRQPDGTMPLALFTAQRIDYSLARLAHYTATNPVHFQNHVLFTNYQFYVDEFEAFARAALADPSSGYTGFVGPGNAAITDAQAPLPAPQRLPQMPAYHLTRAGGQGITLVNIGVGPSNAKTATDHIAVLRPHAWVMVGHCAGLRNSQALGDPQSGYTALVGPDNVEITDSEAPLPVPERMPQMPTYHLKRADNAGVSLVNIGIGPSNAKTATDHIAVLRPHAWLMVGHCAGLRNTQNLGDFVLAHAYVREDNVLNDDLPVWVPIPALAEIQIALQEAVAEITQLEGFELKRIMRTGTVATIDNRNWELRDQSGPVHRLSQSRAIALDMESATIAANGFRFRVPYGTLLCVSDKPLHGELKLPGMATEFYRSQVARHLLIGVRAMELLREMPLERIHSRKLRSFEETAFL